jgi:hypothetical protein
VGAATANTIVTFGLLAVVTLVGVVTTYPHLAVVPIVVTSLAIALVVPVVFYRSSYTTWGAIDQAMHPLEPREIADADGALEEAVRKTHEGA